MAWFMRSTPPAAPADPANREVGSSSTYSGNSTRSGLKTAFFTADENTALASLTVSDSEPVP